MGRAARWAVVYVGQGGRRHIWPPADVACHPPSRESAERLADEMFARCEGPRPHTLILPRVEAERLVAEEKL